MRPLLQVDCNTNNNNNLPSPLRHLIDLLTLWHGSTTSFVLQELISFPNCPQQHYHKDNLYSVKGIRLFEHIPFSIIIALEENSNTTSIMDCHSNRMVIKKGCVAIFRGDYSHAGATYSEENHRLHISIKVFTKRLRYN